MTAGQVFDYNLMKKKFMQRNSRKQCFIKRRSREHEAQIGEKWISLWETVCIGSWKWGKIDIGYLMARLMQMCSVS